MQCKIPTRDQNKFEEEVMNPLLRQWQNSFAQME
jgi:hypothetical protein